MECNGTRFFGKLFKSSVSEEKIAYAISCGSKLPERDFRRVLTATADFDYLSVREEATYKIFKDNGVNVIKVLGPTLLLTKDEYRVLYDNTPIINEEGVCLSLHDKLQ